MTIYEYDERLYRLLKRCLFGKYVSGGGDQLTPKMRRGLLRSIDCGAVRKPCDCGDDGCRSFDVEPAADDQCVRRIRFRVEGELSVDCDDAGRLLHVQWLPAPQDRRKRRHYVMTPAGWRETPVATV